MTQVAKQEGLPRASGNNKGLPCPFKPTLCQEGYCNECQIYPDWQKQVAERRNDGKPALGKGESKR